MGAIRGVFSATLLASLLGLACVPFRGMPPHDGGSDDQRADGAEVGEFHVPDSGADRATTETSLGEPVTDTSEAAPADAGSTDLAGDAGSDSTANDSATSDVAGETPSRLELPKTGLIVQLEADFGLIGADDGTVTRWRDESGNGFDATTDVGFQPPLFPDANAGSPAVVLGINPGDSLALPSGFSDLQGGVSGFFVFHLQKETGVTLLFSAGPNGPQLSIQANAETDIVSLDYHVGTGGTTGGRAFNFSYGDWHVGEVVQQGGAVGAASIFTVFLDGTALVTATQPVPSTEVKTGEIGPVVDRGLVLLQAAVVYSRAVSNDERGRIERYLMSKWGTE